MNDRALRAYICLVAFSLASHYIITDASCGSHRASIGETLFVTSPALLALVTRNSAGLKINAVVLTIVTAFDFAVRARYGPCLNIQGEGAIMLFLGLAFWLTCSASLVATVISRAIRILRRRAGRTRTRP